MNATGFRPSASGLPKGAVFVPPNLLSRAIQQSPASIVITDTQGNIQFVNKKFEHVTGYREQEVLGKNPRVLKSGHTTEGQYAELWRSLASGQSWTGEFHNKKKNGELYWERAVISPVSDKHGTITHYLAVKEDITRQKELEAELRRMSRAVDQSPASIVFTDIYGRIEYVNPKFCNVTGYTAEEVIGKNPRVLKSGETSSGDYKNLWRTITNGREWHGEFHNKKKNGELYWENASISPVLDDKGEVMYFLAVKEDITLRKEMEIALRDAFVTIKVQRDRMTEEFEQARKTQKCLIPENLPVIPGFCLASKYVPTDQIGGDYYDVFPIDDSRFGIVVADVTGHGVSAALLSFMASAFVKTAFHGSQSPRDVLQSVNASLLEALPDDKFVSLTVGVLDPEKQSFSYAVAGHPETIVIRPSSKESFVLSTDGTLAGVISNEIAGFEEKTFALHPGDRLYFYTDAVTESVDSDGELLGLDALRELLLEVKNLGLEESVDAMYEKGLAFSGQKTYTDDVTLLAIEFSHLVKPIRRKKVVSSRTHSMTRKV